MTDNTTKEARAEHKRKTAKKNLAKARKVQQERMEARKEGISTESLSIIEIKDLIVKRSKKLLKSGDRVSGTELKSLSQMVEAYEKEQDENIIRNSGEAQGELDKMVRQLITTISKLPPGARDEIRRVLGGLSRGEK